MDQRPSVVPEQVLRSASKPKPRQDAAREPVSLSAILKRASGPDERVKHAAKLATAPQPASAAPEQARRPAGQPDRRADDPIEAAGQALIALLQSAAAASNEEYDRASIHAGRLAGELRATENRIRELEAEVSHFRERAARAEEWLQQIAREIESKLIPPRRGGPG
jgi:hypothetical protein